MTEQTIADRARFDIIRYAQLWEDADVLTKAMGDVTGGTLISICSAGDNALALLTLDPAKVIAVDLSAAQLACLHLRIGAYRALTHAEFLILMGARPGLRKPLLIRALEAQTETIKAFWMEKSDAVEAYGAGGVGKFERYFRMFRKFILPLTHSPSTRAEMFVPKSRLERAKYFETKFDTWRWRLMMRLFFSRFMMGRMGRDKAFFDHVEGSVADHVGSRLRHAAVDTDPCQNPYLHWIMTGTHGAALPLAWRAEYFEVIRARLARISAHQGAFEDLDLTGVDGFNLSDIFEYMPPNVMENVFAGLLDMANPDARLVYWNMMAARRHPERFKDRITRKKVLEDSLKAQDMAFFYSDFVIEQVNA